MRKSVKQDLLGLVDNFIEIHKEIAETIAVGDIPRAQAMLGECQEFAISIGDVIEQNEGERFKTIPLLESYCELLFEIHGQIGEAATSEIEVEQRLNDSIEIVKASISNDIPDKKEVVFFPYKASMWDSLESIYLAAKADPDVDAYCVPIPYYDRNTDESFGQMHYEGKLFPKGIEIIDWREYDYQERKPDVAYIHNPYDQLNHVTSVHPLYYSDKIKQYVNKLVYVPYFSTAGGMSEYQKSCPAYYNADYIVVQAEKYRKFYDEKLADDKFLTFGSPKFDSVINRCANPPEPPASWKAKMEGKTTYFYNTSLGGMLNNIEEFLIKMRYVFSVFKVNPQACLIWRPHPLFESTIESMRPQYLEIFRKLRDSYIREDYGIYDDTPDITNTIALSEIYIGDEGTSVTSLFGVAGKPIFSLNNRVHELPVDDDWKAEYLGYGLFYLNPDDRWIVTANDKLFIANGEDEYDYHYVGKVCEGQGITHFGIVREIDGTRYICPTSAQRILTTKDGINIRTIELEKRIEQAGAFRMPLVYKHKLILVPQNYDSVVIYDTKNNQVNYYDQYVTEFVRETAYGKRYGFPIVYKNWLFILSSEDDLMRVQNLDTNQVDLMRLSSDTCGTFNMFQDGDDIWMLPHYGSTVRRWNPTKGTIDRYEIFPDKVICINPATGYRVTENPFGAALITDKYVYITNLWSQISAKIDKLTGEVSEWTINIPVSKGSSYSWASSGFGLVRKLGNGFRIISNADRKLYDINPETGEYKEVPVTFHYEECKATESGFSEGSEWMRYKCSESPWNSLDDLLKGNITGGKFDKQKQLEAFGSINASPNGDCGIKVHEYVMKQL